VRQLPAFAHAGTDELLTQMESYPGVPMLTTNMIDSLDEAVMRRIDFKVKLDYPKPEQVRALLDRLRWRLMTPNLANRRYDMYKYNLWVRINSFQTADAYTWADNDISAKALGEAMSGVGNVLGYWRE
jgi:hypothetical protein